VAHKVSQKKKKVQQENSQLHLLSTPAYMQKREKKFLADWANFYHSISASNHG